MYKHGWTICLKRHIFMDSENKTPSLPDWGRIKRLFLLLHLLSARLVEFLVGAVGLALHFSVSHRYGSQLRDSAGLAPASPLSPPIRERGTPTTSESVVKVFMDEYQA
jgi:hypothetical protein